MEKDSDMPTENQTEGEIPFEQMDGNTWCELLCKQPQFADRCPWENLDKGLNRKGIS